MVDSITLDSPLDMHLHLRDGEILNEVAPITASQFAGALVMPNLKPPIITLEQAEAYKSRILKALKDKAFTPYMTLYLQESFDSSFLKAVKEAGIAALKLYPAGATTNSEAGLKSIINEKTESLFHEMGELEIPLPIHGETGGFVLERESEFGAIFETLAKNFPKLKVMMEHISSESTCKLIDKYPNLYATATPHHMLLTLDDLIGGMLNPHHFCKPVVKTPRDREAIVELVTSGHERVFFGSDSAPHPIEAKEGRQAAAGVFSAPVALQSVVEIFEQKNKMENLQDFLSNNARKAYDVTPVEKKITLVKKPQKVAEKVGEIYFFRAGEELSWTIS